MLAGYARMLMKIVKKVLVAILALVGALVLYLFGPGLWHRWVTYPKLEKELTEFQSQRINPPVLTHLNVYQGVLHAHSYWSHDSEGTLSRILPAAKNTGVEFIFLTDHPRHNSDTFPRGYSGYYEGILIEPGSEKHGYCAWPLQPTVIDWTSDRDTVIKNVVSQGGMFFYAHSEEPHNWSNPYYQGMEIYNIHTDTKDESLLPQVFNFIVSGDKYRHWALREIFDEQTAILALWDSLNTTRKIVGFSAVDAHENQNFRARYLSDGRIEWLGPNAKPIDTSAVSIWNRWMLHDPDEEGWIFEFMIDTYETSFNHVANYVFADTLSVASLADHIKKGHLFVAFNGLGDARGFMYCSRDQAGGVNAILGDSIQVKEVSSMYATSPLPGKFRLVKNGKVVDQSTIPVHEYEWTGPVEAGVYRIEVRIELGAEDVPWIYSNPIYLY